MGNRTSSEPLVLLCSTRSWSCALPISAVTEVLRPRATAPLAGTASFVLGVATVRGAAVPVVSGGRLLGDADAPEGRWVSCRTGGRGVILAFAGVDGVRRVPAGVLDAVPSLLSRTVADGVAVVDGGLLVLLDGARILTEEAWSAIDAAMS